jgi:hypothetical protein
MRGLARFRESLNLEVHADADLAHASQPQVVELPIGGPDERYLMRSRTCEYSSCRLGDSVLNNCRVE